MARIAVDAMGGDFAPQAVVRGAESACREKIVEQIILTGNEDLIKPLIKEPKGIEIVHAPVSVEMHETPSGALRKKRDSSMNRGFELLKSGAVQAVVTAGNSGAALAFAIFTLGRIGMVDRPAIATIHPNIKGGITVLMDAGGNVDCKPAHLIQFAIMGDAFVRSVFGIKSPRIGLLSNGQEETKGNELTREVHTMMKNVDINYIGYVEGTDLHNGCTDVVVCDGFVGNVALKISEGIAESLLSFFKESVEKSITKRIGYFFMKDAFEELRKKVDYSEHGGAPLLGVDGICIICHGKSDEKAIKNAIRLARNFIDKNLNESIKETMISYFQS
ncbi:MAG TPA: phosphate acyltransferase PlsX [Deltaproteobacteria bacterium]|nr:phosphate acyltransferase PlsX [Deltaproteobacteria bacterium]